MTPVLGGQPARQNDNQGFSSAIRENNELTSKKTSEFMPKPDGAAKRQNFKLSKEMSFADQMLAAKRASGSLDSQKIREHESQPSVGERTSGGPSATPSFPPD